MLDRRGFLGGLAGATAWTAASAVAAGPTAASPLSLAGGAGEKVIVVGAGIAGLVAALELLRAGYDVQVLEARERVGGRVWTVRRGDRIERLDGSAETVGFDEGLYFNCGPARIPSWHRTVLDYCHEFGVALEPLVNASRSALYLPPGEEAKPVQMRRVINDTRGHVSGLLAKAIRKGALDADLSPEQRANLLRFLAGYGDLGEADAYLGTDRAGFLSLPGAAEAAGKHLEPLSLDLLTSPEAGQAMLFEELIDFQATMLEPVGGMDRIPVALAAAIEARAPGRLSLGREVQAIETGERGVSVRWRGKDGRTGAETADYAVVTLPLPILARTPCNFSTAFRSACGRTPYVRSVKIAWQSPRFWEADGIYGGISHISNDLGVVWYPSADIGRKDGVLLTGYMFQEAADRVAALLPEARYAFARATVDRLHPGAGEKLARPISVVWQQTPYSEGVTAAWDAGDPDYVLLNRPEGRVHLAGEHLSHLPAWQEGAALSGRRAARMIAERARAARA